MTRQNVKRFSNHEYLYVRVFRWMCIEQWMALQKGSIFEKTRWLGLM